MVLGEILRAISAFFEALLRLFGMSSSSADSITGGGPNSLRVFIKYAGRTITADLNPTWSIRKVKDVIAPKLGVEPEEIRIIFAGNDLPDSFVLEASDVGQQSYLHAVRVKLRLQENPQRTIIQSEETDDRLSRVPANTEGDVNAEETQMQLEQIENLVVQSSTRTFVTNVAELGTEEAAVKPGGSENVEAESDGVPAASASLTPQVNTRSDFFVYCSTCEDLKEGKLRVRCAKCLSGAFTVSRHPQGWSDVLLPQQIEGICEVDTCPIFHDTLKYANFYFKCSSHVTTGEDDSSPPLQQVKRNTDQIPCLACGDTKEIALVFTCPSAHATCIDCFRQYSLFKINQRDFIQDPSIGYTLGCPALCQDSLIQDAHHFKLMGKQQYDRYQRFATEECLLQLGGIFCPQPDCGMGIIPEDVNCNKIACMHGCGYVFCKRCLEGWHIGPCREAHDPSTTTTCSTDDPSSSSSSGYFVNVDRAARAKWQDANKRALRLSTKPCPNCRVPTERAGGCMHMECTKCKFQWCWVCQTKWNRECMGNHWFG